ncbi:unnamed protein product [Porites lobata]|uniref:Uncharacterized protein n=1 Tax=Porites lobata TaxID=104759 RepID=A0ABN8MNH8_9CNID|nr:unnamed protein product [Porites lobata]
MNITDKKRKRALLLHYAGEATNEIFDTLPDTTPGEGEDTQNRQYEIYIFRQAKQKSNESI